MVRSPWTDTQLAFSMASQFAGASHVAKPCQSGKRIFQIYSTARLATRSSATNRLIEAKDKASVQLNIGHVNGVCARMRFPRLADPL